MKRTIAYFTDSAEFGGAERYLLRILQQLDRDCWDPVLYYYASEGITTLIEAASELGVALRPIPQMPLGMKGARRALGFARALRKEQIAVFHANLTWPLSCKYGLAAAVLARVPGILATMHSFPSVEYTWSTRLQQRLLARWMDRIIVVSQAMKKQIQQAFWIPTDKIEVIYNGVPQTTASGPPVGNVPLNGARPVVFTAARLDEQKGLNYLLQAAALVPTARFVVAGEGPLCEVLKRMAGEYGVGERVFLIGFQTEIAEWLAQADLFVLPSLLEGLPLSILEAMAASKPVVATQIEGIDEVVVAGETGLLVPPANPPALAEAILSLLADPARAAAMGRAGKARVQRLFSFESMVAGVMECYEAALSNQGELA